MFEFHGWVTIRESTCEAEDDSELLDSAIREISRAVQEMNDSFSDVELFVKNGSHYLRLHGDRNHSQAWVLRLFERVGELATGSYGLLYVMDREDIEHPNQFQVWRMVRGQVSRATDIFLSPCVPVLESY